MEAVYSGIALFTLGAVTVGIGNLLLWYWYNKR